MFTTLNLSAAPPAPIQRLNLVRVVRLVPPLVAAEQCCGIIRDREGKSLICAVIHPYRTAHLYAGAFAELLPLLRAEAWPDRTMSDLTWVDIAYTEPEGSRPQLLVRSARIENATAEIAWQDRDLTYASTWESRVQPVIEVLEHYTV